MSAPPSFSSFPPSFSSFPDLDPGPSKRPSKAPKASIEERDKRKLRDSSTERSRSKTHKEKSRKRNKDRRKDRSHAESFEQGRSKAEGETQNTEEAQRFFYSDRKGDHLNIQYGGLYQGDVPKYRLVGGGRQILGLSDIWVAFHRAGRGVEVGFRDRRRFPGLTDSSSKALLAAPPTRRFLSTDATSRYEELDGFIRIPSRRGNKISEDSYRAITANDEDNSDSDSSASKREDQSEDGSDSESDSPALTSHQLTLKDLDQSLAADPSSVETWLLLLSHTLSTVPTTSKNATKARSEISLSILGRAMAAHPQNATSKLLLLKNIKAGEDIWHESRVRSEWEAAIKVGGVEIWMEWLEWRLRRSNKGIDSIVDDAVRALNALDSDDAGQIGKIRIFWRVAVAFRDAGFTERATAMFQAQAELTFEVPQGLYNLPLNTQLDGLEEFWDSEMPRVGDDGAKGWAAWVRNRKSGCPPAATPRPSNAITDLDPYRQWSAQEMQDDNKLLLPTRSTDESSEFDPYSTVLFADIRPMLLSLNSTKAKDAFRLAWLAFIGLHSPGFSMSLSTSKDLNWDDRWNSAYLMRPAVFNAIFPSQAERQPVGADAAAGIVIGREKAYKNSFGPVQFWGYGVFEPLDDSAVQREKGVSQRGIWSADDVSSLDAMFVRRVFEQLRIGNSDYEWDQLTLAFEAAIDVKKALKQSKVFLSVSRDSLPHWAAHIQLELMHGRSDDARKVFQTVLIASKPASGQNGISQLWWNWAEMEWLAGREEEALNIICTSAGNERGRTSVAFLRTKRALDDAIQAVQDLTLWKARESWIKLRALFELLTGRDLSPVLGYFDRYLTDGKGSVAHESLSVAHLLLVYHYGVKLKFPVPPSILRERAEKALEEYPSNSVILGLFLEGEKGQGVWGRVRGMLGGSDGKVKDMARRVEEVWIAGWEKGRWISEVERTRSGLSAAIEHERTRGSPVLWRIILEFEIRVGELGRAKKLLFRAIGECPLVKELYLVAFGPLRGIFSGHELNGLADTMAERGLRLRRGLDEVLEGWEIEGDVSKGDESDESADEIEHNAAELRRLMPY